MALLEGRAQRQGLRDQSPQTPRLSGDSLLSGDSILSGGLIWAAICAALLKRFLAHAAQLVGKVAVSTRKTAMMLNQSLSALLMAVAGGAEEETMERLDRALQALIRDGKRRNPRPERRTDRQRLGLRPSF